MSEVNGMAFGRLLEQAESYRHSLEENIEPVIFVGMGTCGIAAGAKEVMARIEATLREKAIAARVCSVGCVGKCYAEVLVDIKLPGRPRVSYSRVTPASVPGLIEAALGLGSSPNDKNDAANAVKALDDATVDDLQKRIALGNCGVIEPDKIEAYVARGGYQGLRKALQMKPEEVIESIKKSGLRGRGGAGFSTGLKWQFCREAKGEAKYLICNADEGDPGAFMDRSVLEGDPHAVLEGMLIAAYAIGAQNGYLYCRAEYPLAIRRIEQAISQAEEYGLLGSSVLGTDFGFRVRVKQGAGAFVCGEETALIASIEGRRGMPRVRPPFPAQSGLFGKPTTINNVETLANVPRIMLNGAEWFASIGTKQSAGTKVFALAGKINRSGLIEVPMGTPLRDVVFEIGGGIPEGRQFKAAQTGGPSGGCIPADLLDMSMDYESLAKAGSIVGSGGLIVMDDRTCMVDIARFFLDFTQRESCGKCMPCRLGTRHMLDILERICAGKGELEDIDRLVEISETVKQGSLCGLGQTAPNPVLSTLRYFRDEYEAHIVEHRCPAKVCSALLTYSIDPDKCTGCGVCKAVCPSGAVTGEKRQPHTIDPNLCIKCGSCLQKCRFGAVTC